MYIYIYIHTYMQIYTCMCIYYIYTYLGIVCDQLCVWKLDNHSLPILVVLPEVLWIMGSRMMDDYGSWMLEPLMMKSVGWNLPRICIRFDLGLAVSLGSGIDSWTSAKRCRKCPGSTVLLFRWRQSRNDLMDAFYQMIWYTDTRWFFQSMGFLWNSGIVVMMISNMFQWLREFGCLSSQSWLPRTGLEAWQVFVRISSWRRRSQWGKT